MFAHDWTLDLGFLFAIDDDDDDEIEATKTKHKTIFGAKLLMKLLGKREKNS